MAKINMMYTYRLRYTIDVTDGQCVDDIAFGPIGTINRMIIHPPKASEEKRIHYETPDTKVWGADMIEVEVELEEHEDKSIDELGRSLEPEVRRHLLLFLKYCRTETGQFWIDPRQQIDWYLKYTDENGKERLRPYMVLQIRGGQHALNDESWNAVRRDIERSREVPLYREALLDSKLYMSNADYRMAVVVAAVGMEAILRGYVQRNLKRELVDTKVLSQSQVDKFVEDVSRKSLLVIGLAHYHPDKSLSFNDCEKTLRLRDSLVHPQARSASLEEASTAVKCLEELISTCIDPDSASG
jgi:hypothetical protein